jgi:hypothetical protein
MKHDYKINRWHWFHGFSAMKPRRLEVECVCTKCGKKIYSYPKRNSENEKSILAMKELEDR